MAKKESQPPYPGMEILHRGFKGNHYETLNKPKREPVIRFRDRLDRFYPQISRLHESEYNFIIKAVRSMLGRKSDLSNPITQYLGGYNTSTSVWQVKVRNVDVIIAYQSTGNFPITPVPSECLYIHPRDGRQVFNDLYNLNAHLGDYLTIDIPSSTSNEE